MITPTGQLLVTAYVPLADIVFQNDVPMSCLEVQRKVDEYVRIGPNHPEPLMVEWRGDRPHLLDGRHRYIAALMLGRRVALVGWHTDA